MGEETKTPAIVVAALVLILGIIHLAVASAFISQHNRYENVLQQPVGLSGFNIVIGVYGIAIGIMGLVAILRQQIPLGRGTGIASAIEGVFAIASLITALALNAQAITYIRQRLTDHMTSYVQSQGSINVVDRIQTDYQCCGVNLWLDWGRVSLGAATGVGVGTGIGTGVGIGTGTGTGTGTVVVTNPGTGTGSTGTGGTIVVRDTAMRQVHRESSVLDFWNGPPPTSALVKAVRRKRQIISQNGNLYGLPSTYTINLPISCCRNGGNVVGQSLGGYCVYSPGNSTINFYVDGCIGFVANAAVSQIMALGVINTCMAIVSFLLLGLLRSLFPQAFDTTNPQNKQPLQNETQWGQQQMQQPQYMNGGYYAAADPNMYYSNPPSAYVAPAYTAPAYAAPVYPVYQQL